MRNMKIVKRLLQCEHYLFNSDLEHNQNNEVIKMYQINDGNGAINNECERSFLRKLVV